MNLTSFLYKVLRISRDVNAIRRGPRAVVRRAARKALYRTAARTVRIVR